MIALRRSTSGSSCQPRSTSSAASSDNIGALLHDPASGACAAIDAPEEEPILAALEETGWTLERHPRHPSPWRPRAGDRGAEAAHRLPRRRAAEGAAQQVPAVDAFVREGDTVHVGGLQAHVWETPGHCADHVAYWFAADRALFAGDTLFTLGCGRVLEGSYAAMWIVPAAACRAARRGAGLLRARLCLSNARFALAADPDNAALQARAAEAEARKAEGGASWSRRRSARRRPRTPSCGQASRPSPAPSARRAPSR